MKILLCTSVLLVNFLFGAATVGSIRWVLSSLPTAGSEESAKALIVPAVEGETPLTVAGPALAKPASIEPSSEPSETSEIIDRSGEYHLDEESLPKRFKEFQYLELTTGQYKESGGEYLYESVVPYGKVVAKSSHKITYIAISPREIAFETTTAGGVSYRFKGWFLQAADEPYCELEPHPDLKGTLTKLKNGKWVAEMDAEFYVFCGC